MHANTETHFAFNDSFFLYIRSDVNALSLGTLSLMVPPSLPLGVNPWPFGALGAMVPPSLPLGMNPWPLGALGAMVPPSLPLGVNPWPFGALGAMVPPSLPLGVNPWPFNALGVMVPSSLPLACSDVNGLGYILTFNMMPMVILPEAFLGDRQSSYGFNFTALVTVVSTAALNRDDILVR